MTRLNLRTLLSKQFSKYEIMSEYIGLTHTKDCDACSRWKDVPLHNFFDLHGCVRMKIFSWEHVSVYNLIHNFLCLSSTDMFPRSVSTTRRFHTLKDGCLHTFWVTNSFLCVTLNMFDTNFPQRSRNDVQPHNFLTYEPFYACNYWHIKPCLSALFEQCDGLWGVFTVKKRHNFTQRFDLQGHACMQIFTYKDVSVCNVSPNFSVLWQPPCFHANISTLSCSCTSLHAKSHVYSHFFVLWRCVRVQFGT